MVDGAATAAMVRKVQKYDDKQRSLEEALRDSKDALRAAVMLGTADSSFVAANLSTLTYDTAVLTQVFPVKDKPTSVRLKTFQW